MVEQVSQQKSVEETNEDAVQKEAPKLLDKINKIFEKKLQKQYKEGEMNVDEVAKNKLLHDTGVKFNNSLAKLYNHQSKGEEECIDMIN